MLKNLSLRSRIFITTILLVLIASVLIAGVTIYQYREQSKDYHERRLERKEDQVKASIGYVLQRTTWPVETKYLGLIFKDEIYRIANVQKVSFDIYDLEGALIKSSQPSFETEAPQCLEAGVLNALAASGNHRFVEKRVSAGNRYQSSFTYITDNKFKPIGILNLPYFEDDTFNNMELKEFLMRLGIVYVFMFGIAILLAYFISKYITRSLKTISEKLDQTHLSRRNEKIIIKAPSTEIGSLIDAYNSMVDQLEESAVKLARGEREQAWREMARQVAHEVKNPLTPMRLTVQNFEKRFDPKDPKIKSKIAEFSKTLIQQIDTMSSIASAFSSFARMPVQKNESLNVVEIVKLSLEIFNHESIHFLTEEKEIIARFDRTQLIRIINNMLKNALQAIPEDREPRILVSVLSEGENVKIMVADNGAGVQDSHKDKIFEPTFTTKSSGMGLGLVMVKNIVETYGGSISMVSQIEKGTVFTILFPRAVETPMET